MAAGKIEILVETEVKKSIANIEKQIQAQNKVKKNTETLASAFKKLTAASGVVFAIKKVLDFTKASRDAADVQEESNTKLNAVLKATKGVAGLTSKELQNMASEYQNLTTFGDEVTMSAQSTLLTFREVGQDVFPRATMAAMDMSQIFGSLDSSMLSLGKALNDPITGLTALSRQGVTFSESQKEQIRLYQENGEMAKAQGIILDELENQFGGTAIAMAQTAKGVRTQLGNEFGDIQESIGEGWNKISTPSNKKLLEFIKENKRLITGIFSNLPEVSSLAFETVKTIIKKFLSWDGISSMGKTLYDGFYIAAKSLPELLYQAVRFGWTPIRNLVDWIGSAFDSLSVTIKNKLIDVLQSIPIVGEKVFGDLEKEAEVAPKTFGESWNQGIAEATESFGAFKDETISMLSQIGQVIGEDTKELYGSEIESFKQGVENIITAAEEAKEATDLLDSTADGSGGGTGDGDSNILPFEEGLQKQILDLENERAEAKKQLVVIQELISAAEEKGVAVGSAQMSVYLEEEKRLREIIGLKDEEVKKAGELEQRMKDNWNTSKSKKYYESLLNIAKATDWVIEKTEKFSGVIDSLKGAYSAWQSYSESVFDKEIAQMEARLEALNELNEATLEVNQDLYDSELEALDEALDNDVISREQYLTKKAELDAKKLAQDKKVTAEADKLEAEITKKKNEEAKKRFELEKAASIASAVVSGALAVVQALSLGPIAGPIAAGIIAAAVAVQVGMIASQEFVPEYAVGTANVERDHLAMIHQGEGIIPKTFNDAIKSGEYSLSGGNGSSSSGNVYQFHFHGDIYGGEETTEKIFESIEEAQRQGRLPEWTNIA